MLSTRGNKAALPQNELKTLLEVWDNSYDAEINPAGYINLGTAENALMHHEMQYYINEVFEIPELALTYGDGGSGSKRSRAAISHFVNKHFKPLSPITSEHINVSNGVTTSVEGCAWHLGDRGDGFLLGQPYYGAFPRDIGARAGVKVVDVKFDDIDPFSIEAVAKYEDAILTSGKNDTRIKGFILCNPHNPLGRCYSRDTLIAIMRLCQKYRIHLISDEIYALSVWQNPEYPAATAFTSVLSIDTNDIISPELVHVVWGMSKDFGANGLRLGFLISQHNPDFMLALKNNSLFTFPSSASDYIATKVLENDNFTDNYIAENQRRLSGNYDFVIKFLHEHDISYYPGSNAAFFVWVDLGGFVRRRRSSAQKDQSIDDSHNKEDNDITAGIFAKLLKQRLYLANGDMFGSERPGWFRIVFSQPREYLKNGLERMVGAIES